MKKFSRLKKGQPKRFKKGDLVFPITPPRLVGFDCGDWISTWNKCPLYNVDYRIIMWPKESGPNGKVFPGDRLIVIATQNYPHHMREQYCFILRPNGKTGWISSRYLERTP